MQESEPTIVSGAQQPPDDRTQVVAAPGATLMGGSVQCPVCHNRNIAGDTYCSGCGFLLSSQPQEQVAPEEPLALLTNSRTGQQYPLQEGQFSVGRDNSDILLPDPSVSRSHAQIAVEAGKVTVTDLGSTNGTSLNGAKLTPNEPLPAPDGAEIVFGTMALTLTLRAADAAEPQESKAQEAAAEPVAEAPDAAEDQPAEDMPVVEEPEEHAEQEAVAILQDEASGTSYNISDAGAAIGRRAGNDIILDNPYVSSSHAVISVSEGRCTLIDIGSTNGTTLNGQKLNANEPAALSDGDQISFGPVELKFRQES